MLTLAGSQNLDLRKRGNVFGCFHKVTVSENKKSLLQFCLLQFCLKSLLCLVYVSLIPQRRN